MSKIETSNMEASNCQKFGHEPSIFSSLLGSLILATSILFFAINRDDVYRGKSSHKSHPTHPTHL